MDWGHITLALSIIILVIGQVLLGRRYDALRMITNAQTKQINTNTGEISMLAASRILGHPETRVVAGQDDDGTLNGLDYTEKRWVTAWLRAKSR